MRQLCGHLSPAGHVGHEIAEAAAGLRRQLVAVEKARRSQQQWLLKSASLAVDGGDRLVAKPALGLIDDALEGQVVSRLIDQAQVSDRIADLGPFVKAE